MNLFLKTLIIINIKKSNFLLIENSQMTDRAIHPLGPKRQPTDRGLSNTQYSFNKSDSKFIPQLKQHFFIPVKYIYIHHPQIIVLFNQLVTLRKKYDQLAVKFINQSPSQSQKQQIQEVIQSSHEIQQKMSRIIQQTKKIDEQSKENNSQTNARSQIHEQECLNIIQTVNRATQKIEEMEKKNFQLQNELKQQMILKQEIEKQNKRLKLIADKAQSQKNMTIQILRKQLQKAKQQQEKKQSRKNEFYMNDSPKKSETLMLSRLDMDGLSRISQIYE